jgi:polysaccharide pyruvyl transferase WcaK-like protein
MRGLLEELVYSLVASVYLLPPAIFRLETRGILTMGRRILRVLVSHAYSSKNRGDGLLVDLTRRALEDAFGHENFKANFVCIDANSFADLAGVFQFDATSSRRSTRIRGVISSAKSLALPDQPVFPEDHRPPDLIVAVGGGYLRTTNYLQGLKALIAHGSQLRQAANTAIPSIYLPQSVGPFRTPFGAGFAHDVRRLSRIYVRDDRSFELLRSPNVRRVPDLAVYEIARKIGQPSSLQQIQRSGSLLVARRIEGSKSVQSSYADKLKWLRKETPSLLPAVQSTGRGNDDPAFYSDLGWEGQFFPLRSYFTTPLPSAVVSVRLHGALESLAAGIPTVHLSYERKGFGAYQDLGIGQYVHNVYSFDPKLVLQQVRDLTENAGDFWDAVYRSKSKILSKYEEMIQDIRSISSFVGVKS